MGRYQALTPPAEYNFVELKERIWKGVPLLVQLLLVVVGNLRSGATVDCNSFGGCVMTIVTVLSHFARRIRCSSFNTALALYLHALGIKRRCLGVLHGLGLVPTYQSIISHSAKLSDLATDTLKQVSRQHRNRIVIVWDNSDYDEKVYIETLKQKSEHFSATTGLIIVSDAIPPEGIPVENIKYDVYLDPFDIYEVPDNQNDDIQHKARMYFFFKAIKSVHPGAVEKIFKDSLQPQPQFPHIERLEPKFTTWYEMGPIMEDEGSISGTLAVMNQIMLNVLGYKEDDPEFGRVLQLTYGDQKTVSLVHSVKQMRK
ncbi:hypothetical protein KEM56_005051 [Ascosphaera pollenicola]|nr:hypothetical protein KEM56_005051 [Ascosphaera pollenicola]